MISILLISISLVVAAFFAIYFLKRKSPRSATTELLPAHSRGLFDEPRDGLLKEGDELKDKLTAMRASEMRARAANGDLSVLLDARSNRDTSLYREILDTLVERSAEHPALLHDLSVHVTGSPELRSTPLLAGKLLEHWKQFPSKVPITELLRVAALSDDAGIYERVIVTVFELWNEGRPPKLEADKLRALFESEYWLLSGEARNSGAGFVLREKLSDLRRRLAASTARTTTHSNEADALPPSSQRGKI